MAMEPINYQNNSVPFPVVAVPLGVRIISWIILFFGTLFFLGTLFIMIPFKGGSVSFALLPTLIQGALLVFVAFGLRKMKRWGLYLFTLLAVWGIISAVYGLMNGASSLMIGMVNAGISLIVLVYLWSMSSRWV